jgi:hypothetical protein
VGDFAARFVRAAKSTIEINILVPQTLFIAGLASAFI